MRPLIAALAAVALSLSVGVSGAGAVTVTAPAVDICPGITTAHVGRRVEVCYAVFANRTTLVHPVVQFLSNGGRFSRSNARWQRGQWNAVSFGFAAPLRAGECAQARIDFTPSHTGRTVIVALLEGDAYHPNTVVAQTVIAFTVTR